MAAATKGTSISLLNMKLLVNQFATLAIVATCSSFIFSMGGFDISLGAVTCLAAVVGAAVLNAGRLGSRWCFWCVWARPSACRS